MKIIKITKVDLDINEYINIFVHLEKIHLQEVHQLQEVRH